MEEIVLNPGYDQDGNPQDYTDENGVTWIYEGRDPEFDSDRWSGIPPED